MSCALLIRDAEDAGNPDSNHGIKFALEDTRPFKKRKVM
jgi:hypothetical protein